MAWTLICVACREDLPLDRRSLALCERCERGLVYVERRGWIWRWMVRQVFGTQDEVRFVASLCPDELRRRR